MSSINSNRILFFVPHTCNSAYFNMAFDEAMLLVDAPILRVYTFNPYAVTVGRLEKELSYINFDYLKKHNLSCVRRITGGRAVLHAHSLTYSFAAPYRCFPWADSVISTYNRISSIIIQSLQSLGLDVELSYHRVCKSNIKRHCFATSGFKEILIEGRKLVGSAQVRKKNAFLQHGSIILDPDAELVFSVFKGSSDTLSFCGLNEYLDLKVDIEEFQQIILKEFLIDLNLKKVVFYPQNFKIHGKSFLSYVKTLMKKYQTYYNCSK